MLDRLNRLSAFIDTDEHISCAGHEREYSTSHIAFGKRRGCEIIFWHLQSFGITNTHYREIYKITAWSLSTRSAYQSAYAPYYV